jgi:hypothetical protein
MVRRGRRIGRRVQAPEPPSAWRRWRLRARRAARFPPHSNGVGFRFQARATASSQAMISSGLVGCCPASARRFKIRCIDSVMFNQEPPKGVYNLQRLPSCAPRDCPRSRASVTVVSHRATMGDCPARHSSTPTMPGSSLDPGLQAASAGQSEWHSTPVAARGARQYLDNW